MQSSIHFDDIALVIGDRYPDREGAKQGAVFFTTLYERMLYFLAPLHLHLERLLIRRKFVVRCSTRSSSRLLRRRKLFSARFRSVMSWTTQTEPLAGSRGSSTLPDTVHQMSVPSLRTRGCASRNSG